MFALHECSGNIKYYIFCNSSAFYNWCLTFTELLCIRDPIPLTTERRYLLELCHQHLWDSLCLLLIQVCVEVVGGIQSLISWLNSKTLLPPAEMEAILGRTTSVPLTGCIISEHNTVSKVGPHFGQGQHELTGTPVTDPKNTASKRPYSPTSTGDERPKKITDGEKVRKRGWVREVWSSISYWCRMNEVAEKKCIYTFPADSGI